MGEGAETLQLSRILRSHIQDVRCSQRQRTKTNNCTHASYYTLTLVEEGGNKIGNNPVSQFIHRSQRQCSDPLMDIHPEHLIFKI